jgi:hypothetical protein
MSDLNYGFTKKEYETFPPVVQIAIVSGVCPSNCKYCPVGRKNKGELSDVFSRELQTAFFDIHLYQKIVDEIASHPGTILRLHSRGEPLEHPLYTQMVGYAKSKNVTLTSFTNGILLNKVFKDLVSNRIDLIEISADAHTSELYGRWRRNDHFLDVLNGVKDLFHERNSFRNSPTRIVISAVGHEEFMPYKEAFQQFWSPWSDKVIIRPFHNYAGRIDGAPSSNLDHKDYIPCVQLWERFSINPYGGVNACFNDWGDHELVGNLNDNKASIASIWRGEEFEKIRSETLSSPYLHCCSTCSGPSLSSWGDGGYQYWVGDLLRQPAKASEVYKESMT